MIQTDDNEILGRNLKHYTRICSEIKERADTIAKGIFSQAIMGKKVDVVLIIDYTVDSDNDPMPMHLRNGKTFEYEDKGYVTVSIPGQFRINKQTYKYSNENFIRLVDTIYMQILKRIQEKYPEEEHDLHNVLIERVSILSPWQRYEAQL